MLRSTEVKMSKIKILHMYADMLDLYGDSGNMEIISYRCKMRGIECEIHKYSIDSEMPDFSAYDLIYIGGGADLEQQHISEDLVKCREGIEAAYKNGTFLFLICGGYQLMGKYYRDADGVEIPGLGLFDYYTMKPLKGYYPFYIYSNLYELENQVLSTTDDENLFCVGAKLGDKVGAMVTYYSEDDNLNSKIVTIDINGADADKLNLYLTDDKVTMLKIRNYSVEEGKITIRLERNSILYIEN
jgi:hypothetical protein